jgi:hypothetical protein
MAAPLVVWHAKLLESDDWLGAEYFDWPRFDRFLISGRVLLQTFADFKALLQDGFAEEKGALVPARAGRGPLSCAQGHSTCG